jgi:hypothetical protein
LVGNPERSESSTARVVGETAENRCDFNWAGYPHADPEGAANYNEENYYTGRKYEQSFAHDIGLR